MISRYIMQISRMCQVLRLGQTKYFLALEGIVGKKRAGARMRGVHDSAGPLSGPPRDPWKFDPLVFSDQVESPIDWTIWNFLFHY